MMSDSSAEGGRDQEVSGGLGRTLSLQRLARTEGSLEDCRGSQASTEGGADRASEVRAARRAAESEIVRLKRKIRTSSRKPRKSRRRPRRGVPTGGSRNSGRRLRTRLTCCRSRYGMSRLPLREDEFSGAARASCSRDFGDARDNNGQFYGVGWYCRRGKRWVRSRTTALRSFSSKMKWLT